MFTIQGPTQRYCDGIGRRSFLKIGAFAFGSVNLTLADILRAESRTGRPTAHKAVINIFLGGGPPHQDMWDIKTDAPRRDPGRIQADQHQRPEHPDRRVLSQK
jgi:hypothetical protein